MTRQPDQIEPIVPRLPADATPTLTTDGGPGRFAREPSTDPLRSSDGPAGDRTIDFDRPPRTDHAPADRCREEIEPLVPDLR